MDARKRRGLGIAGLLVAMAAGAPVPAVNAQEQPAVPNIGLTLTETLNRLAAPTPSKDDLREIPKPKNDKLPDSVRITVSVGDGQCLPGEDGMMLVPRSARRSRTR